ncbi:hypothetical protein F5148DRAFT_1348663 [Russula earlei]|uniref:Uncharacterized protein n=1 Tax=Russula earlei TaxID=71964 RepID=A0ACC0UDN4_9AGAM|nr:hypothetical protein F5148DRAFT_1348663 [Russula earlei]
MIRHRCPYIINRILFAPFPITISKSNRIPDPKFDLRVSRMRRIRQACRFLTRESRSNKGLTISQDGMYGDPNDEWGILPHHFQTVPLPPEQVREVKAMRSMPHFSKRRKNSKLAQILGVAGASRDDVNVVDPPPNVLSPPMFPMEADPFSRGPLGATIIGTGPPIPVQHDHCTARVTRPLALFLPEVACNPPPTPSVPSHSTTSSRPLHASQAVDLESQSKHGLISAHRSPLAGTVAPLFRDAAVAHRERHHNRHDRAALNLRKARSSVVLSNTPLLPLHAPKPLKVSERPSVATLRMMTESASAEPTSHPRTHVHSHHTHTHAWNNGITAASTVVWPPAPVLRPLQIVMPPRAERDAIEAEKTHCKIVERARHDRERSARRGEHHGDSERQRSRHRRRAETEGSRRGRRGREVEYRTMADYGYFPTDQNWAGAWW